MENLMKKVAVNGVRVKELRSQLERLATQKEMANEIGISVRKLRNLENKNASLAVPNFNRLARALGVNCDDIVLIPKISKPIEKMLASSNLGRFTVGQDLFIPRFDEDSAAATWDEGRLFTEASSSQDVTCIIKVSLNEEVGGCAQELIDILVGLSWSHRNILASISPSQEISLRRRIKQLLVLLKGNDVWVYQTSVLRRLPERDTLPPNGEAHRHEYRLVVALGPPGEFGETTMMVPVDNGQPWLIPAGVPDFGGSPEQCSPK
jgi:transcriptional regulator with XRE-family HTH domain